MLGRWFRDKAGWKWVEVTEDEEKQLQEELSKKNIEIMNQCRKDAGIVLLNQPEPGRWDIDFEKRIAIALFDKRATQYFTFEKAFLDKKLKNLRESDVSKKAVQQEM